jgi:osmoprotectant transport system ATP-binding protein
MNRQAASKTSNMIQVERISKTYGKQIALAPTTLEFAARSTTTLIGPSGCGKSTLLRIIAGLVNPDSGRVFIQGRELNSGNANELRHRMGYLTQDGGLFPHLNAERNVTLLARYLKRPIDEIERRMAELAELVRLPGAALTRYPAQLSGGQRQRVALMRALMLDPQIVLLDEPLGALDPITRSELQTELKAIFSRLEKTVVLVTHDMGEAAYFEGEIVLMREGHIVQRGPLRELLDNPAEGYVADFIRAQRSPLSAVIDAA